MKLNCILAGVGGQGTVVASKIIGTLGVQKGWFVRTAETIGMAQRGGSVTSHLRIGEGLYAPMVPKGEADLIIGFEPGEAVRCMPYLRTGGMVISVEEPILPTIGGLANAPYRSIEMTGYLRHHAEKAWILNGKRLSGGQPKTLNIALLGAAVVAGGLPFTPEELLDMIRKKLPPAFFEANRAALFRGIREVETQSS